MVVEKAVAKAEETVVDEEAVEKVEGVAEQEPGGEMEGEGESVGRHFLFIVLRMFLLFAASFLS
jgi:hypothetical protein